MFYFNLFAGLDIGPDALRLLQLSRTFSIKELKEVLLPKQTFQQGECKNFQTLLAALVVLKKEITKKNLAVVAALMPQLVDQQLITLPKNLTQTECALEIENNISKRKALDYFLQSNVNDPDYSFTVVMAQAEYISMLQNTVNQAGFYLKSVDTTVFALARALQHFSENYSIWIDCREELFIFLFMKDEGLSYEVLFYSSLSEIGLMISKMISNNVFYQNKQIILSGIGPLSELKNFLKSQFKIEVKLFAEFFRSSFSDDLINRAAIAFGLALWRAA